jgi:hypothetical protein
MTEPDGIWSGCSLVNFQGEDIQDSLRKSADWLSEACSCDKNPFVHLNRFHFMHGYFQYRDGGWELELVMSYA